MQAMLTIAQLVNPIAKVTGLEEETVRQHARFVREAGFLPATVGKRLAYATPRHAAVLLGAILMDHRVIKAGAAASTACALKACDSRVNVNRPVAAPAPEALFGLAPNHSFVEALAALIEAATHGDVMGPSGMPMANIDVIVKRPVPSAQIDLDDGPMLSIRYAIPAPAGTWDDSERSRAWFAAMTARYGGGDLSVERRVTLTTIGEIGDALAGVDDGDTPPEAPVTFQRRRRRECSPA